MYKSEFDTGSATDGSSPGAENGPDDIDADSPDTDGGSTTDGGGTTGSGDDSSDTGTQTDTGTSTDTAAPTDSGTSGGTATDDGGVDTATDDTGLPSGGGTDTTGGASDTTGGETDTTGGETDTTGGETDATDDTTGGAGETTDGTGDTTGGTGETTDGTGETTDGTGETTGSTGDTDTSEGTIDYCHVQFPCELTGTIGEALPAVYVWVYKVDVTDDVGEGAGIEVELGIGADGTMPDADWSWTDAHYYADKDGLFLGDKANDEYEAVAIAPSELGVYDYAARVRVTDGEWTLCDLGHVCGGSGTDDGYAPADAGSLMVVPGPVPPDPIETIEP